MAPCGRKVYYLLLSVLAACPVTFGYAFIYQLLVLPTVLYWCHREGRKQIKGQLKKDADKNILT
jgi:hypothetical protein